MNLPPIDPNVVAWFSVISSVVTVLASVTAAVVTVRHYFFTLRDKAREALRDVKERL